MQIPLRNDHIFMKDAQCAETNENQFLNFFLFKIDFVYNFQVLLPTKYGQNQCLKRCAMF